jgi:hypothetical protein
MAMFHDRIMKAYDLLAENRGMLEEDDYRRRREWLKSASYALDELEEDRQRDEGDEPMSREQRQLRREHIARALRYAVLGLEEK